MFEKQAFINLLVSNEILSDGDAHLLMDQYEDNPLSVMEELLKRDAATKKVLGKLWGDLIQVAYVDPDQTIFQPEIIKKLPEKFARKYNVIPLYKLGERITVTTSDPLNGKVLEETEKHLDSPISVVFSFQDDIQDAIDIQYQSTYSFEDYAANLANIDFFNEDELFEEDQLEFVVKEKPVKNFTHALLLLGVAEGASSIHIEHQHHVAVIRFRVDGILHEKYSMEKDLLIPMVARLKYLAKLDILEMNKPQFGRININLLKKSLNFRFSSAPMIHGEKIVIRILNSRHKPIPDLTDLILSKSNMEGLKNVVKRPGGLFFITGPASAGKTTTLFSMLKHLNSSQINIITIEEHTEFRLPGINRILTGQDFDTTRAFESILDLDPDVVLAGEVNHGETARIAAQAAMDGCLVLLTMRTNNALDAIPRLIEMGVSPLIAASSIAGAMAQRLVRRVCDYCKESYAIDRETAEKYFINPDDREIRFYRGAGCKECKGAGFSGQLAIHELFVMSRELQYLVANRAPCKEIENAAAQTGYKPFRYDGMKKVLRGLTTIEELERVAGDS